MLEVLETITKIKNALGGEECDVYLHTNNVEGISVRVYWHKSDCGVERIFSTADIKCRLGDVLVDYFIEWAQHEKEEYDALNNRRRK